MLSLSDLVQIKMDNVEDDGTNDDDGISLTPRENVVYSNPYDTIIEAYQTNVVSLESLYSNLNYEVCSKVSKASRAVLGWNSPTLAYGEIAFDHFGHFLLNALKTLDVDTNNGSLSFVDIGCGSGKAVFAAYMMSVFSSCTGIELVPELYKSCLSVLKDYQKHFLDSPSDIVNISFTLGDATYIDWSTHDVAFANATSFDEAMMARLLGIAGRMKLGSLFVCLTHMLPLPQGEGAVALFDLMMTTDLVVATHAHCDPDSVTAYVYRRNGKYLPGQEADVKIRLASILNGSPRTS